MSFFARYKAELLETLAIVLATLSSYLIARALNLAEPFWAVITAAIVARLTARVAVYAAAYRLAATLAGAFYGLLLAFARPSGSPEPLLLVLLVAPLGLLAVFQPKLRAALIAGIIVFSAAAHLDTPIAPALARIMEVGLGAVVAAAISVLFGLIFTLPPRKTRPGAGNP
ncbi:MAG: FUSC family protein [Xanthobacteraceae bacterium]|nr:FUSC family protein [Xanthobacteraceae bacterium]